MISILIYTCVFIGGLGIGYGVHARLHAHEMVEVLDLCEQYRIQCYRWREAYRDANTALRTWMDTTPATNTLAAMRDNTREHN